ncbi:MAG: hypothetical protein K2G38_03800, partial [Clostridia bacterium]|nr:hypothetical protein [Clostridia bacterium]
AEMCIRVWYNRTPYDDFNGTGGNSNGGGSAPEDPFGDLGGNGGNVGSGNDGSPFDDFKN